MAIPNDKVKKMEEFCTDLGELIKELNPVTEKEWDAFSKVVDAHKNLMKIDTDSLRQLPFPIEKLEPKKPKARKDCPRCKGTGSWFDPADKTQSPRLCNCAEVGDIPWPTVKKEWEEALALVEA